MILKFFVVDDFAKELVEADVVVNRSRAGRRAQSQILISIRQVALNTSIRYFALDVCMIALMRNYHAHVFELFGRLRFFALLFKMQRQPRVWLKAFMSFDAEIISPQQLPRFFIHITRIEILKFAVHLPPDPLSS